METDNTSGQGAAAAVPPGIDRWNWGAFFLNWIWGIGNSTYIAFLMFVPLVNLVVIFMLGAKGSIWAWRNRRWASVEEFQRVQRNWARWGLAFWALVAVGIFAGLGMLKNSEAYTLARAELERNPEVIAALGQPISTGTPMGSIRISGPDGEARLQFSAEGPNGEATVYVEAVKQLGRWEIRHMALDDESTGRRIDIK